MVTSPLENLRSDKRTKAAAEAELLGLQRLAKGDDWALGQLVERQGSREAQAIYKAAQPAATTANFAGAGVNDGSLFGGVVLRQDVASGADEVYASAVQAPGPQFRFQMAESVITVGTVTEGSGSPVRRAHFNGNTGDAAMGRAIVVYTKELFDSVNQAGVLASIRTQLLRGATLWSTSYMLSQLAGNSGESEAGNSVSSWLQVDFSELTQMIGSGESSVLYLFVAPRVAKAIAAHLLTLGINVPRWERFDLAGVRIRASDAQSATTATMIDATQVAMWMSDSIARFTDTASLEMDDAPPGTSDDPMEGNAVSLWQDNAVAWQVSRAATVQPLSAGAYASMTGIEFGAVDSPSAS
jgi:hypothetical protein